MSLNCPVHNKDSSGLNITRSATSDDAKIAMCACLELANCRAENCQLKQKLTEYEAKISSLEHLVATIAEEQLQIRQEVIELRNEAQGATMETADELEPSDNLSVNPQEEMYDEDEYDPDSESEYNAVQSPNPSVHSSLASLVSLNISSTSSMELNVLTLNDNSDSDCIYSENEDF
ncbi:uncharacterized protein LOC6728291 [Drosophila simulans]|uniref:GD20532 n=1 Tax=Drosophila simulans TaxID=7240 RepID=B4R1Z1_DROSI|nr:uncharacterized protein LOC6728291 [Drosophila simulans]EDX13143.1 GD20532 [Drosophila simulans]KMZ03906.1 uncharacterized protein Dsimw501_GD20532 [Drosophila simulans]